MMTSLLELQFSLLFALPLLAGVQMYGCDLNAPTGYLMLAPLVLAPFLRRFLADRIRSLPGGWRATLLYLTAVWGLATYRLFHLSAWDEHSWLHVAALGGLGTLSALCAMAGGTPEPPAGPRGTASLAPGLALCAAAYGLGYWYPLAPLGALGVVAAAAAPWATVARKLARELPTHALRELARERSFARTTDILLFLGALDLARAVWDYGYVTTWSLHVALALATAAAGSLLALAGGRWLRVVLLIDVLACYGAALVWPDFVLDSLHAGLCGLALGYFLADRAGRLARSGAARAGSPSIGSPLILGFAASLLFAQYTSYSWTSGALLLLAALPWALERRRARAEPPDGGHGGTARPS